MGITILKSVRNEYIRVDLGIRDIGQKIEEKRSRYLGRIVRRDEYQITKGSDRSREKN